MSDIQTRNPISTKWYRLLWWLVISIIFIMIAKFEFSSWLFASILMAWVIWVRIDYRWIAIWGMWVLWVIMILSMLKMQARAEQSAVLLYFLLCIATFGSMYHWSSWQIFIDRMIDTYWQDMLIWLGDGIDNITDIVYGQIVVLSNICTQYYKPITWSFRVWLLRYVYRIISNGLVLSIAAICINVFVIHIQFNTILSKLLPSYAKLIQYWLFTLEQLEYVFWWVLLVVAFILLQDLFRGKS